MTAVILPFPAQRTAILTQDERNQVIAKGLNVEEIERLVGFLEERLDQERQEK